MCARSPQVGLTALPMLLSKLRTAPPHTPPGPPPPHPPAHPMALLQLDLPVSKGDVKKRYCSVPHLRGISGTHSAPPIFAGDRCPARFPHPVQCCAAQPCSSLSQQCSGNRGRSWHTLAKKQQDKGHRVRLGKAFSVVPPSSLKTNYAAHCAQFPAPLSAFRSPCQTPPCASLFSSAGPTLQALALPVPCPADH